MDMITNLMTEVAQLKEKESLLQAEQTELASRLKDLQTRISIYDELISRYSVERDTEPTESFMHDTPPSNVTSPQITPRRRMSSHQAKEVWNTIRTVLSDGKTWSVGDLRREVEKRMSIGEINRTTIQSLLKRNESELLREDKGYIRLKSPQDRA